MFTRQRKPTLIKIFDHWIFEDIFRFDPNENRRIQNRIRPLPKSQNRANIYTAYKGSCGISLSGPKSNLHSPKANITSFPTRSLFSSRGRFSVTRSINRVKTERLNGHLARFWHRNITRGCTGRFWLRFIYGWVYFGALGGHRFENDTLDKERCDES